MCKINAPMFRLLLIGLLGLIQHLSGCGTDKSIYLTVSNEQVKGIAAEIIPISDNSDFFEDLYNIFVHIKSSLNQFFHPEYYKKISLIIQLSPDEKSHLNNTLIDLPPPAEC